MLTPLALRGFSEHGESQKLPPLLHESRLRMPARCRFACNSIYSAGAAQRVKALVHVGAFSVGEHAMRTSSVLGILGSDGLGLFHVPSFTAMQTTWCELPRSREKLTKIFRSELTRQRTEVPFPFNPIQSVKSDFAIVSRCWVRPGVLVCTVLPFAPVGVL